MTIAQTIPTRRLNEILEESIAEQRRLVLTHNTDNGWRTYKSKFVSGSSERQVIQAQTLVSSENLESELPQPGDTLGVTFRLGHKKCMFGTTLESFEGEGEQRLATMRWPDNIQQLQRRVFERATPPHDAIVPVRMWCCEGLSSAQVDERTVKHGQLEDVSAGGMRVKAASPLDFRPGATFRCVFAPRPGKPSIVLDALVRHRESAEQGRSSIGFQFVGLEATPDGRRVLERLVRTVTQFQRARHKTRR